MQQSSTAVIFRSGEGLLNVVQEIANNELNKMHFGWTRRTFFITACRKSPKSNDGNPIIRLELRLNQTLLKHNHNSNPLPLAVPKS